MSDTPLPWVRLMSGQLSAEIDPHGAQLSVLKDDDGRDLLWNGDPAVWAGRAPLLFPIVGALAGGAYRVGSATYPLPRHGFARGQIFSIEQTAADAAVFRLRAGEASLKVYPFQFELDVHFELKKATLRVTSRICNKGAEEMPASFGYHPAFRWPLPFGQPRPSHFIEFEREEAAPIRRLDAAGLLTEERHPTPVVRRRLALDDALFRDDAIIFDKLASRSVTYGAEQGPRIQLAFPDATYLGIWSKPGAEFVCIEPWHGVADPQGFSGNIMQKPGISILKAGETLATAMAITLLG
jgi:galactose mutarotase-like enzyme